MRRCVRRIIPALLLTTVPASLGAQVTVVDSAGAPVPFVLLESPSGQRLLTDARGVAMRAAATDGPWRARRIGYRPAESAPGATRIVLARLPVLLPTYGVAASAGCTRTEVGTTGPREVIDALRATILEHHERRLVASATDSLRRFRIETTLVTETGPEAIMDPVVETLPLAPSGVAYDPGQAVVRVRDDWQLRRPRLVDLTTPVFLEAHCVAIDDTATDSTVLVRFTPRDDLPGPQVIGRLVLDRRTGRLLSDTVDYVRVPKGAPGNARLVIDYAPLSAVSEGDPLSLPVRIVETVSPADLRISTPSGRQKVVRTVRTMTRLDRETNPPG